MYYIYIQKKLQQFSESAKKEQRLQTDIGEKYILSSSTSHTHFSDSKSSTSTSKIMEGKETISTEKLGKRPPSYRHGYPLPDIKMPHSRTDLPATSTIIEHPVEG